MSAATFTALLGNIWSIFLIILFFGGSIFVHELGHFLAARRRGLKVSRFSIGFGPAMFSHTGRDGVEYRINWLPLGGYVALPQLADLSGLEGEVDPNAAKLPPISYSTKLIVFVAGAVFNVLFAFTLASILWIVGQPVVEEEQTTKIGFVHPTIELPNGKSAPGP
ncbi:MAG: site-2 protease family protein, partial [Opitutaceae bacterium]